METVTNLKAQWEARLSEYAQRKQTLETEILDARKSLETAPPAARGLLSKVKAVVSNAAKTLATNSRIKAYAGEITRLQTEVGAQAGDLSNRLVHIAHEAGLDAAMKAELASLAATTAHLANIQSLLRAAIAQTDKAIEWQNAAGTVGGGQSPSAFSAKEHTDKAVTAVRAVAEALRRPIPGLAGTGGAGLAAAPEDLRSQASLAYGLNLDGGGALLNFEAASKLESVSSALRAIGGKVRDAESQIIKRRQSLTQQALAKVRESDGEFDALCVDLTPWLPADHTFRTSHAG